MCRFVAYRGKPVSLAQVISAPEHSLIEQSYQPKEMTAGTVNVDGLGSGGITAGLNPRRVYTRTLSLFGMIEICPA